MVKNLPANTGNIRDTSSIPGLGRSPGGGTHASILVWRIPQTEDSGGYSQCGRKDLDTTEHKST